MGRDGLEQGVPIIDALVAVGLCKSKSEARRAAQEGGVYLNNNRINDPDYPIKSGDLVTETTAVLRRGKKELCPGTVSIAQVIWINLSIGSFAVSFA